MAQPSGGNILIVDDTPNNLSVLRQMLTEQGHRVRPAISGEIALKTVRADLPDLILLDIVMPQMNGYEVCRQLKKQRETKDIPIIFISALNEMEDKMRAFSEGGVDYISKPFHSEEVLARVSTHLTLSFQKKELKRQNQELKEKNALILDQAEELKKMASKDFLTGLSNRRDFIEKSQQEETRFLRTRRPFAVILLDIDYFKQVNDTFGHDCGDIVLKGVAHTLETSLRQQDLVARWGGEEFICLLPETDFTGAMNVAEKIRISISSETHKCSTEEIKVTTTVGVAVYNGDEILHECIARADKALYQGKADGRNQVCSLDKTR